MDEIVREVVEAFDLPPAKARALVEMVAARLQSTAGRERRHHNDDDDHDHDDQHRDHYHEGGRWPGKQGKKGGLRGLLGDVLGGE